MIFQAGDVVTLADRPDREGTVLAAPDDIPGFVLVAWRAAWGAKLAPVREREDALLLVNRPSL